MFALMLMFHIQSRTMQDEKTKVGDMNSEGASCPFLSGEIKKSAGGGTRNRDWWPNQLKLNILRQHSSLSNPMDGKFNYAEEFLKVDLNALKKEIVQLMTTSQSWW